MNKVVDTTFTILGKEAAVDTRGWFRKILDKLKSTLKKVAEWFQAMGRFFRYAPSQGLILGLSWIATGVAWGICLISGAVLWWVIAAVCTIEFAYNTWVLIHNTNVFYRLREKLHKK